MSHLRIVRWKIDVPDSTGFPLESFSVITKETEAKLVPSGAVSFGFTYPDTSGVASE